MDLEEEKEEKDETSPLIPVAKPTILERVKNLVARNRGDGGEISVPAASLLAMLREGEQKESKAREAADTLREKPDFDGKMFLDLGAAILAAADMIKPLLAGKVKLMPPNTASLYQHLSDTNNAGQQMGEILQADLEDGARLQAATLYGALEALRSSNINTNGLRAIFLEIWILKTKMEANHQAQNIFDLCFTRPLQDINDQYNEQIRRGTLGRGQWWLTTIIDGLGCAQAFGVNIYEMKIGDSLYSSMTNLIFISVIAAERKVITPLIKKYNKNQAHEAKMRAIDYLRDQFNRMVHNTAAFARQAVDKHARADKSADNESNTFDILKMIKNLFVANQLLDMLDTEMRRLEKSKFDPLPESCLQQYRRVPFDMIPIARLPQDRYQDLLRLMFTDLGIHDVDPSFHVDLTRSEEIKPFTREEVEALDFEFQRGTYDPIGISLKPDRNVPIGSDDYPLELTRHVKGKIEHQKSKSYQHTGDFNIV